jgi:hypothetical protein
MNMKKLQNFHANPTVYCMHQSDKRYENQHENSVRTNMQFWYSVEKFTSGSREVQMRRKVAIFSEVHFKLESSFGSSPCTILKSVGKFRFTEEEVQIHVPGSSERVRE